MSETADSRHRRAVAALSDPATYRDVLDNVVHIETHVSDVFLADRRAHKLKKPLRLAFLDYGTAQRRRAMCEQEVRLNRRLAPGLYHGVRAVVECRGADRVALRRVIPSESRTLIQPSRGGSAGRGNRSTRSRQSAI